MPELPGTADLAAHQKFVRALARSLVADAHAADDLVQDAWLAALTSAPRSEGSLRGWFATVLRRRAAETHREGANRLHRSALDALPGRTFAQPNAARGAVSRAQGERSGR